MREKCPNTEFFSGPYFPAFEVNKEKYGVMPKFVICVHNYFGIISKPNNAKLENIYRNYSFELLTRKLNFYFSTFKLKNI